MHAGFEQAGKCTPWPLLHAILALPANAPMLQSPGCWDLLAGCSGRWLPCCTMLRESWPSHLQQYCRSPGHLRWLHMSVPVPASCHTLLWCCLETLKVLLFAGPAAHWCWAACGGLWQGQRLQQQHCLSSGQQPPAQQHPCGAGCGRTAGAERQRSVEPGVYLHLGGKPQCFNFIRLEMKPLSCSWTV